MNWVARISITLLASIAVALGMTMFPLMSKGISIWNSWPGGSSRQITDQNLVDLIVQMPLQLRIRKVELNDSILSIDLNFPKNGDSTAAFRDLYRIAQMTVSQSSNINQILVRVMDYSNTGSSASSNGQLLLAMVAGRERAKSLHAFPKEATLEQLEQELKGRFQMTYTPKWQERTPLN